MEMFYKKLLGFKLLREQTKNLIMRKILKFLESFLNLKILENLTDDSKSKK